MPKKVSKKEVVEVIEKPKRGRKKRVPVATEAPVEESTPAPVPKKKRVKKTPVVVVEEVKEEVKPVKKSKTKAPKDATKPKEKAKRPPTAWMIHVKAYRKENPDMAYKDVLKNAKGSYVR